MRNGHPAFSRTVDTGPARIEWGDTLNSPALAEADRLMRFNVVVANPPLEAQADRYNRFWCGVLTTFRRAA